MEDVLPMENFAMVEPGVYRSSFPRTKNISFLKRLNLKSVIPLIPEDYPLPMVEFYKSCGIKLLKHGLEGNKLPFKGIDVQELYKGLIDVLDPDCRPCLIHCNKGKHRTGSIVGCLRKLRGWSLSSIVAEYYHYAAPKARIEDQIFIDTFKVELFTEFSQKYQLIQQQIEQESEIIVSIRTVNSDENDAEDAEKNPSLVSP